MKIKLITIGKISKRYLQEGILDYSNRLKHYCNIEIIELKDIPRGKNVAPSQLKNKEAIQILNRISDKDYVVLLDEKGKNLSSRKLSEDIEQFMSSLGATKDLVYVIGGAFGFGDALYQRSQKMLSLSRMTFSHQMIRMIFLEQIYRAFTIMKNEKYHND